MYQTDYPLYKQYKYWESADNEWYEADGFSLLAYRTIENDQITLRLTAHREGMPSVAEGSVQAAQKTAFNIMTADCGSRSYNILPSKASFGSRIIDRYFYQNADLSIGVAYRCHTGKPSQDTLAIEAQKWSLATRRWDKIDGIQAYVDILPENNDGLNQIRIRLFGGKVNENGRLARRIMLDTCQTTNFKVLFKHPSADIVNKERQTQIVSDENVWVYGFSCRL